MANSARTCQTAFTTTTDTKTCGKTGIHLVHRDPATGDRFIPAPGGAVILPAK